MSERWGYKKADEVDRAIERALADHLIHAGVTNAELREVLVFARTIRSSAEVIEASAELLLRRRES